MKSVKLKGIVLRSIDYKENSKICYMLTEQGLLSIRALGTKGYKNKNFNFSEILNNCEMEITDSDFPSLIDFSLINRYDNIKKDIKALSYVSMMLEVTRALDGFLPYQRIYNFLITVLNLIEKGESAKLLTAVYLIKMLKPLGIKPEFDYCVNCGGKAKYLDIRLGQAYYESDTTSYFELEEVKRVYYFDIKQEINNLKVDLDNIYKFIFEYYMYHLDINLKKFDLII